MEEYRLKKRKSIYIVKFEFIYNIVGLENHR